MKNSLKTRLAVAAALMGAAVAQAATPSWTLYDYTATIKSNTTISGTSFAAGSSVAGQVYLLNGVTPDNGGWGFAGEVARYVDVVNAFSFNTSGLSVGGTGAGNAEVDNNRRLVRAGGAYQDVFAASLGTEPTTSFTATALGGGLSAMSFMLRSPFLGGAPSATTSLALPSAVNLGLFSDTNSLQLSFKDASLLDATLTSMTVSQVSQIAAVPEPATAGMAALGLLVLGAARRRRQAA
ncbi:PEP-CTERM putative exosortase interaction domain-containing protein [Burkholderiales bacterium JOSHI_001]|nr:PEP-CTERM putative exosortase interaction domain-containing protein [Burkholderiales bacterium JOSHI_001]